MDVALVFAGGSGQRMRNSAKPKQFLELYGKPIIIYTLEVFEKHPEIDTVVVPCIAGWEDYLQKLLDKFGITKVSKILTGGKDTQESKMIALRYLQGICQEDDIVLLHDAVRPLVTEKMITDNIASVREFGNGITAVPFTETAITSDDGKEIRRCFIPEPGCLFFSADYSQIELRIMAHLSEDKNMVEAFREGSDIHAATAAKIWHEEISQVTDTQRKKAKTANFGIIYGITTFGLAQRMNIENKEAKQIIEDYFRTFPGVKAYMEKSKEIARKKGYAETIFHRRRYLPDINSRNGTVRGFAERNAINAPIQGSEADIIKVAMVRIFNRFKAEGIKSKMIIQVHDELNFSVYPEEKEKVEQIVVEEMQNAYHLSVPLVADAGWGKNWLEAH